MASSGNAAPVLLLVAPNRFNPKAAERALDVAKSAAASLPVVVAGAASAGLEQQIRNLAGARGVPVTIESSSRGYEDAFWDVVNGWKAESVVAVRDPAAKERNSPLDIAAAEATIGVEIFPAA
ncbi:MAG: hypothetical protein GMKNLPBB_00556 [Myxococcota bacterium]|nr:hypothetical protein [Myxococcota bacterium]